MRVAATVAMFAVIFVLGWGAISQHSPKTPQIKSEKETNGSVKDQANSQPSPQRITTTHKKNPYPTTEHADQEGTEFWGPLFGYKFKITDALLVLFTFILAIFTGLLYCMARKQDAATRTIERAYVKMSHARPGLIFNGGIVKIAMEFKNHGETPANVTDASLGYKVVPPGTRLPRFPEYEKTPETNIPNAFLVKGEQFFAVTENDIGAPVVTRALAGECIIFVVGYVDYRDIFLERHRAGYARVFNHRTTVLFGKEDNLDFVTQPGYNYDRPRKKGEGNDWENSPA